MDQSKDRFRFHNLLVSFPFLLFFFFPFFRSSASLDSIEFYGTQDTCPTSQDDCRSFLCLYFLLAPFCTHCRIKLSIAYFFKLVPSPLDNGFFCEFSQLFIELMLQRLVMRSGTSAMHAARRMTASRQATSSPISASAGLLGRRVSTLHAIRPAWGPH